MKIAIAQINPIIGDVSYNCDRIIFFADRARKQSCDLVIFSELVVTGYPPRDLLEKNEFIDANLAGVERLVNHIEGIGVICGYVEKNKSDSGNPLTNAAILFEDGKILHQVSKRLLPTYDVFDERRYFEPGSTCDTFRYKGRNVGLTICEDTWNDTDKSSHRMYHFNPLALLMEDGADLIVNVSASPFYVGKKEIRWNMLGEIARKYQVPIVYTNQTGGNDSILFDGISTAFNREGQVAACARDFEEDLVTFDLETEQGDIHPVAASGIESIAKGLVMGTRDYVVKCGFSKAVIGLSGGIDSAVTAAIAVEALGHENVSAAFMPSQYTSPENFEDTRQLADNLGIELARFPIDDVFDGFLQLLAPMLNTGESGIAEQNIQARIRGTVLMALSNQQGSLLLSTGNKSELSVGYCTLYGDMNGGLAVISDVPKTMVYELAGFFNREGEVIPLRIIEKAPSAELKPDQTDQDDLPPYDLLDSILKAYIEDLKGMKELISMGFDSNLVKDVISRINRNEYKRHQAAPGLKVTSKAFGSGRRYPIAQRFAIW